MKNSKKRGAGEGAVLLWAVRALDARDAFVAHNAKPSPFGKGRVAYWDTLAKLRARMNKTGNRHMEAVRAYKKAVSRSRASGKKGAR